jgi:hypothetical protein
MHEWSSDALWNKAKIYIDRAFTGDRESQLFPFFAAIELEFLARAALARVHPSLLADPQDGNNILYGFGYPATERPITIPFFAPKKFECKVCGLEIVGSQALRVAGLSDQIVDEETTDPVEFFGIDPMDYIDEAALRRSLYEEYDNE